ncbi:regulatory protein RecX [Wukongibacter baidiensis]|uniref:regulatory protein RecX n=1 Tax=Wukongibacter baidiensis TaxID=1723361 RepID=UPI003D7FD4C8
MLEKELKITKLETQKRNKNRVSIYINDEFAIGVSRDIIYKLHIEEGKVIDKDYFEEIIKSEEQKKANEYAVKLLSYRPRSQKEIEDKMKQKGYDAEMIDKTIKWLREYNLINDEDFAKEYILSKSKKYGSRRIKMELGRKGVNEEVINEILDEEIDYDKEYSIALECAKKKMKAYKGDERNAIYRKLASYLQRRGFSYDIISKILKELL